MHSILAKEASLALQSLKPEQRKDIIERLADLLLERQDVILAANKRDLAQAHCEGK